MVLIGAFAGMVTGLTGASAVMIVVPLVNLLLNFSVHESIGVSLMVDVIASLAISYTYYRNGNVDLRSGIWIALGSISGAQLGALFSAETPEVSLGGAFGIFLIFMGIAMWKKGLDREALVRKFSRVTIKSENQRVLVALILGLAVGIMTGIFGAGGGMMVLLILIFVLNFPIHLAVGTSTLIMAITASSGALGYALHKSIKPIAGLILGLSAACAGYISAKFANAVNEDSLTKVIGALFVILGFAMIAVRLL